MHTSPVDNERHSSTAGHHHGPMGFQDLPGDWADRPLTDPQLVTDVLDLVVMERDRRAGGLGVLICDGEKRLAVPMMISEVDELATEAERRRGLETIAMAIRGFTPPEDVTVERPGIHLAIARRDGLSITDSDRAWRRAALVVCADDIDLLGVHVVTCHGSRTVPADRSRDDQPGPRRPPSADDPPLADAS